MPTASTRPSFWTRPQRGPARLIFAFSGRAPSSYTHNSTLPEAASSRSRSSALLLGPSLSEPPGPARLFVRSMVTSPVRVHPASASLLSKLRILADTTAGGAAVVDFSCAMAEMGRQPSAAANRPAPKLSHLISPHDAGSSRGAWHKRGPIGQQTF